MAHELGILSRVEELISLSPADENFFKKVNELFFELKALNISLNGSDRFKARFLAYKFHKRDFRDIDLNPYFFMENEYCWVGKFKNGYCWMVIDRENIRKKLLSDTLFGDSNFNALMKHGTEVSKDKFFEKKYVGLLKLLQSEGFKKLCRLYEVEKVFEKDPSQGRLLLNELNTMANKLEKLKKSENLYLEMFVAFSCGLLTIAALFFPIAILPSIALTILGVGLIVGMPYLIDVCISKNVTQEEPGFPDQPPLTTTVIAEEVANLTNESLLENAEIELKINDDLTLENSLFPVSIFRPIRVVPKEPANDLNRRDNEHPQLTSSL